MPNVNEFITYCSNLGIDHIEVLDDVTYESLYHKTGILSEQYEVVRNMAVINITTYENYQKRLDGENIVFFVQGKVKTSGVNFKGKYIGSMIKEIENRTEAEAKEGEYWGVEGVKQFLTDLIHGDLNLKEDENGTVTLPISENTMYVGNATLYERGSGPEPQKWYGTRTETHEIYLDSGIRIINKEIKDEIVAQGLLGIKANSFADLDENNQYSEQSLLGKIQRKINILKGDSENLINVSIPWLYNKFGIYPNSSNYDYFLTRGNYGTISSGKISEPSINYSYINDYSNYFSYMWEAFLKQIGQSFYEYRIRLLIPNDNLLKSDCGILNNWRSYQELSMYMYRDDNYYPYNQIGNSSSNYVYTGVNSNGGYDKSKAYVLMGQSVRNEEAYKKIQRYNEQPFLIGMVPWITDILQNNNIYYCRCWMVLIGFKMNGEILMPLSINEYPTQEFLNQMEYISGWGYQRHRSDIDFQGHIAFRIALEMTEAEYNYALSVDHLLIPVTCLNTGDYIINP